MLLEIMTRTLDVARWIVASRPAARHPAAATLHGELERAGAVRSVELGNLTHAGRADARRRRRARARRGGTRTVSPTTCGRRPAATRCRSPRSSSHRDRLSARRPAAAARRHRRRHAGPARRRRPAPRRPPRRGRRPDAGDGARGGVRVLAGGGPRAGRTVARRGPRRSRSSTATSTCATTSCAGPSSATCRRRRSWRARRLLVERAVARPARPSSPTPTSCCGPATARRARRAGTGGGGGDRPAARRRRLRRRRAHGRAVPRHDGDEPDGRSTTWRPSLQAATALIASGDARAAGPRWCGCASRRGRAATSSSSPTRSWRWAR